MGDDEKKSDFSVSKMEEMMARCRDFVRTQQSARGEREGEEMPPEGSDGTALGSQAVASSETAEQLSSENRQTEREKLWQQAKSLTMSAKAADSKSKKEKKGRRKSSSSSSSSSSKSRGKKKGKEKTNSKNKGKAKRKSRSSSS